MNTLSARSSPLRYGAERRPETTSLGPHCMFSITARNGKMQRPDDLRAAVYRTSPQVSSGPATQAQPESRDRVAVRGGGLGIVAAASPAGEQRLLAANSP